MRIGQKPPIGGLRLLIVTMISPSFHSGVVVCAGKNSSAPWTVTRRFHFVPVLDPSLVVVPRRRRAPAPSPASLQETIVLDTTANQEIVDITDRVRDIVRRAPAQSGIVTVTSQHTTCAVCVNENEHFLKSDILEYLNGAVPSGAARYKHNDLGSRPATARDRQAIEDNDCGGFGSVEAFMAQEPINAHAHLQAILVGNSVTCGVRAGGELGLGSWQSVLVVELDGPRAGRKVDVVLVF
jgi:thiamine phosphate synthase YjbQ (UPF0047 family)